MGTEASVFCLSAFFAAVGTGVFRRLAVRLGIVDTINTRSLHKIVRPRAGGVVIVLIVIAVQIAQLFRYESVPLVLVVWFAGGFGLAILGFLDDLHDVAEKVRLLAQGACACAMSLATLLNVGPEIGFAAITYLLLLFFIIWCVNAANFMDGADGLLSSQAVIISASVLCILDWEVGNFGQMSSLSLCGACVGFLLWNWSPAKIFLGDVGSYFIGFQLAALVCWSMSRFEETLAILIIITPLLADASLTIIRRILFKERVFQAHRSHVYQLLILKGRTHAEIAVSLGACSIFVYLPLALIATHYPRYAIVHFVAGCAAATIVWLVLYLNTSRKSPLN